MGNSPEKKTMQFDSVSNVIRFLQLLLCVTRCHWTST